MLEKSIIQKVTVCLLNIFLSLFVSNYLDLYFLLLAESKYFKVMTILTSVRNYVHWWNIMYKVMVKTSFKSHQLLEQQNANDDDHKRELHKVSAIT